MKIPGFRPSGTWRPGHTRSLTLMAGGLAFLVYSCMYAFRKPFTAAAFEKVLGFDGDYKLWLVLAQLAGYTISKFWGIRLISEMPPHRRAPVLTFLILLAWLSLLGFALAPPIWGLSFMLLNGVPLGLVWGLVFSYLEGRRTTELMGAMLSISFIFSSGFVKSVGSWLMLRWQISEFWMPFLTGALFIGPFLFFIYWLNRMPPPDAKDQALRSPRTPMSKAERRDFLAAFLPGITALVIGYVILSIGRDFRDNFAAELFRENGFGSVPAVFTATEIPVSSVVLASMGLLFLIRDNVKALLVNQIVVLSGLALVLAAGFLFWTGILPALGWITLTGVGFYLGYVPFNCLLFERLIAAARRPANAGFLIYVADALGYLGVVGVYLFRMFQPAGVHWTRFFLVLSMGGAVVAILAMLYSQMYFNKKLNPNSYEK